MIKNSCGSVDVTTAMTSTDKLYCYIASNANNAKWVTTCQGIEHTHLSCAELPTSVSVLRLVIAW